MNPTNAPMPLCESALTTSLNADHGEQILKGLYRGGVGFLIAPPESGKSYTVLSMAYELALPHSPFLGLRPSNSTTYKTLLWPMEDAGLGLYPRLLRHLANFSQQTKACLKDNISLFQQSDPLVLGTGINHPLVDSLIEQAKGFDLLVIDTLREAIGAADEVKDDNLVRTLLSRIATEADVAILVVHHPTKEVSRGSAPINSVSGSGLSSTLSKSKLHLYLEQHVEKGTGEQKSYLRHSKANYLTKEEGKLIEPVSLFWTDYSLIYRYKEKLAALEDNSISEIPQPVEISRPSRPKPEKPKETRPKIPTVIPRDESLLSEESKSKAKATETNGLWGGGMSAAIFGKKNKT